MSNGGYKPGVTEAEFPSQDDIDEHIAYLRGERTELPALLSNYYRKGTIGRWIAEGLAVSVNVVPYRSPSLSSERENQRIAKLLPSRMAHRRWLWSEVLPAARQGLRFVLVHRNSWWQVPPTETSDTVEFSDPGRAEPNRPAPDQDRLARAKAWLRLFSS
jgi:hypothetical protein